MGKGLKAVGIGLLVFAALSFGVAYERYRDNAANFEAVMAFQGRMGMDFSALTGGQPLKPAMPTISKYAIVVSKYAIVAGVLSGIGGVVLLAKGRRPCPSPRL